MNDNTISEKPKSRRGFASMDPKKVKKIARLGGIAAHKQGTAYEWNTLSAARAGALGGRASRGGRGKLVEDNNGNKP